MRTLDDQVRAENTHGADANTGLGSAVCGSETREDDGRSAAHGPEERLEVVSCINSQCGGLWHGQAAPRQWRQVWEGSAYGVDGAVGGMLADVGENERCRANE
jgi:hypothetical protein